MPPVLGDFLVQHAVGNNMQLVESAVHRLVGYLMQRSPLQ